MTKYNLAQLLPNPQDNCIDAILQAAQTRAGVLHEGRENILTIRESRRQIDDLLNRYPAHILKKALKFLEKENFRHMKGMCATVKEIRCSQVDQEEAETLESAPRITSDMEFNPF